jgi:hypothetical protein
MHEISPLDWGGEFQFIGSILQNDGQVLVVEDLLLPHGENAHQDGFVIASKEALRRLFCVDEEAGQMRTGAISHYGTADRLMCVSIPAKFISQISSASVKDALEYINSHASHKIQEIRNSKDTSFRSGLLHALYLHQFANSTFALKRLT